MLREFRNLGWIGGTGSRRQAPCVCESSGCCCLRHQLSRRDLYDLEVGLSSTTSSTFLLNVTRFRSTRGCHRNRPVTALLIDRSWLFGVVLDRKNLFSATEPLHFPRVVSLLCTMQVRRLVQPCPADRPAGRTGMLQVVRAKCRHDSCFLFPGGSSRAKLSSCLSPAEPLGSLDAPGGGPHFRRS